MLLGDGGGRLWVVDFGSIFAAAQIVVDVHAGANVFGSDDGFDGLHGGGGQFLVGIERCPAGWTSPRKKRGCRVGVDDRNILGPQAIDGAGNQLRDSLLGFAGKRATARFHDDGGFRFVLLLAEQRLARQHQVDAHRLDFVQGLQRAFKFAFEGALVVNLLTEVRSRPIRRVEEFEAESGVARQPLRGGFKAGGVEFVGGNEDTGAVRGNFVGDILGR